MIETPADQCLQSIAQRPADVGFGYPADLDALHRGRALMFWTRLPSSLIRATRKMTRARSSGRATERTAATTSGCSLSMRAAISISRCRLSGSPLSVSSSRRRPGLRLSRGRPEIDGLDDGAVARFDVLRACGLPRNAEDKSEEEQVGSP